MILYYDKDITEMNDKFNSEVYYIMLYAILAHFFVFFFYTKQ